MALSVSMWAGTAAAQNGTPAPAAQGTKNVRGFVPKNFFNGATVRSHGDVTKHHHQGNSGSSFTPTLSPFDSLVHWSDSFAADGFDPNGSPQSVWNFTMIGNAPDTNRSAVIRAPIIPVTIELLGTDGKVVMLPNGQLARDEVGPVIVNATVQSPLFQPFTFSSGTGQFNDQMQRASFWNRFAHFNAVEEEFGWHTLLLPAVQRTRVMQLPAGSWLAALNDDGTCCSFIEADADVFTNLLFPSTSPVTSATVIGAAELAGDMTTTDLTTLLFHNLALFTDGDPTNGCCILGFHSYDSEPGDHHNGNREKRYVMDFASWTDPGLFAFGFGDVSAMSHELAEAFNDPFLDNIVPWWLSQDPLFGTAQCQDVLETGDVVEVLDSGSPIFSATLRGRTYHLQNEAMFPWFAEQSPSTAHLHAYSFPDETTLTSLSPHPLTVGCLGAPPVVHHR